MLPSTSSAGGPPAMSTARIFVCSPPPASIVNRNNISVPIHQLGHHRDKLDLIRDSLKPFEQPNGFLAPDNHASDDDDGCEVATTSNCVDEPPEEIQRMMIHALAQVGYDRESAYYALKLVNFNSVMDAANVLANIKQNLQSSHEEVFQQQCQQTSQQQQRVVYHSQQQPSMVAAINASTLSSNARAALSRYGVMPTVGPSTVAMTTTTIGLESNGSTVFGSKLYINPTTSPQLAGYQKPQLNAVNSAPHGLQLSYREPHPPQQKIMSAHQVADNGNSERSPLIEEQINRKSVSSASRTPSPRERIQQQINPYSPRSALRYRNSFDPADQVRVHERLARRDADEPTSSGAATRILRNERVTESSSTKHVTGLEPPSVAQLSLAPTKFPATAVPNVRTIYVDPDASSSTINISATMTEKLTNPPAYGNYMEQVNRMPNATSQPLKNETTEKIVPLNSITSQSQYSQRPQRCVSPLPESVARRLRTRSYEPTVRLCKAAMFRFFMEQHIEKLIQQYRERKQRAIQLTREMELAKLAETMQEQMIRLLRQKESKYIRLKRQKMNKNMFDMIRHIGVGAFGKVTLVSKKDTGQVYAMKTLSKEDVIQKQQAAHVKAERDILAEANSNWIVKLFFSFQDARNLYFIMEYVPGGDMMQLLINKGVFSERLARFYVAELTCAIEYVHSLGFIHRDIKPDNILIDQKGHIKLTDFGLCTGLRWTHDKRHYVIYDDDVPSLAGAPQHYREDSFTLPPHLATAGKPVKLLQHRHHQRRNQAHSVVGTGNYMAPEVIKKTGHTQLCDWWSVGVILYEMVYGRPPFMSHNENPAETQYMIVNWRHFLDLENPMGVRLSRHCVDIIARLCCDEEMRLGRGGACEIKAHSWFRGINFAELRSQPAEYVPMVAHAEDTSNFDCFELNADELFATLNNGRSAAKHVDGSDDQNGAPYNPAFFDFTFRHFFASDGTHGAERSPAFGRATTQQRPSLAPLIEAAQQQQQQTKKFDHHNDEQQEPFRTNKVKKERPNGGESKPHQMENNKATINISEPYESITQKSHPF